jgi:peptidoglycan/LPS O-acetylase OafA/YrhL
MAMWVFFSHAAIWTGNLPRLHAVFIAGGLAVDVFMFISGFLMFWHYQEREAREPWTAPGTWCKFWVRRFFRMAPLYWVALLITFVFLGYFMAWTDEFHRLYPPPWMSRLPDTPRVDEVLSVTNVLAHVTFLFGFIPKFAANNPLPDWSIGLEMQFYLAFPFLALGIRKFGWPAVVVVSVLVWQIATKQIGLGLLDPARAWGWFPMPTFLPLRLGVFISGMLGAFALSRIQYPESRVTPWLAALASVGCAGLHNKWFVVAVVTFLSWEYLARTPLKNQILGHLIAFGNRLLRSRPVKFIADCSYGVYLWHMLVQLLAMRLLQDFGIFAGKAPLTRYFILVAVALPTVYSVAYFSYRAIEMPGIRLGKRLLAKRP